MIIIKEKIDHSNLKFSIFLFKKKDLIQEIKFELDHIKIEFGI
jgi:hypothetical protein